LKKRRITMKNRSAQRSAPGRSVGCCGADSTVLAGRRRVRGRRPPLQPAPSEIREQRVDGNPVHPGGKVTGVLEGVELRLHYSERLLSHVFGQTVDLTGIEFAARVAAQQGEYIPQNALSDLGPGSFLAIPERLNSLRVGSILR
jgi:hypothetical protein